MKPIKSAKIISVFFIAVSIFLSSCSKEENKDENLGENAKMSGFLKSFYKNDYQFGASTNTKSGIDALDRQVEVEDCIITEVFVGNDEVARGYVITNKATNDFLYFIDVDRVQFRLTAIKFDINETKVFNNINELDKYLSTDELDYIRIAEDYASGNTSVEEMRFWGWGPAHPAGDCIEGRRYWVRTYYVLGVGVDTDPVPNSTGTGQLWSPCGEYVNP